MNHNFAGALIYVQFAPLWDSQVESIVTVHAKDATGEGMTGKLSSSLPLATKPGISIGQSRQFDCGRV